jgi:hypothetical protein
LAYVIARGNQGGVVGQSLTIHRHQDKGKLSSRVDGWAQPFKVLKADLVQTLRPPL